jgi:hypothetical protein
MAGLLVLQRRLLLGAQFGGARATVAEAAATRQIKRARHHPANGVESFLFVRTNARERI